MFNTIILTTDPDTGSELKVSEELRSRVDRAAEILKNELVELSEKFDIEATWRFVPESCGKVEVRFDLTTRKLTGNTNVGAMNNSLPIETLQDDESILRALRKPLWHFSRTLSGILKEELERIRRDLQVLATVSGE